jgi:outer membrane protein
MGEKCLKNLHALRYCYRARYVPVQWGRAQAVSSPVWVGHGSTSARRRNLAAEQFGFGYVHIFGGAGGQIHNAFTLKLSTTYFITDHIALDLATGVPPKLKLYAQGNATPFGAGGPSLNLGNLQPLATTRSWAPVLFLKYFFFDAQTKLRPFVGIGANYTWYSHTELNPTFSGALQQIAGPGGQVKASLSPSWNPAFEAGVSYNITKNLYATASVTYLSLKTNATVSSVAANGQTVLANRTHITADPVITFGYRF